MFWTSTSGLKGPPRFAAGLAIVALIGGLLSGCDEEPTQPFQDELVLPAGVSVFLTVDDARASVGSVVNVTGRVRAVDADLTPTAYTVGLGYDPERLEPLGSEKPADGALRSIHLQAEPGLVLAAGAAANGLDGGLLFQVVMKVKKPDYVETLSIDLRELIVLENNFADIATDVNVLSRPVLSALR